MTPSLSHTLPEGLHLYAVARPALLERGNHPVVELDPTHTSSVPFLRRLERLDRLIYSPSGMETPRWAFYDCAELPGTVFGLCASADRVPEEARELLGGEESQDLLPLNAVVAIPTVEAGHWLVYVVCGLDEVVETGFSDLRAETLHAALEWLGALEVSAVCQWAGGRIALHLGGAAPELRAAWMPSHDRPATCCLHYALCPASSPTLSPARWVSSRDEESLRDLQSRIEAGRRYFVVDGRTDGPDPEWAICEGTAP
ncbi:MAG: hypothetical protein JRG96_10635 [Deltaproteobacteria bacterium]|nr:hypothetical protein [Deltaproteobacteria bacterium]MBW2420007.1 hypothetical protein [Deltaproteobacteria bacterium]